MTQLLLLISLLAAPPAKPGWTLAFDEEFDTPELNLTKLSPHFDNDPSLPATYSIKDGVLHLRMDKAEPPKRPDGKPGRVSCVETRGTKPFAQKLGRFEIRARCPKGSGLCAGFWLLPADKNYIKVKEAGGSRANANEPTAIDVSEFLGKDEMSDNFCAHYGRDKNDDASDYSHYAF